MVAERAFADDPLFRAYKSQKKLAAYYPSTPTVRAYLKDVNNSDKAAGSSYLALSTQELIKLADRIASHTSPSVVLDTEQGRAFTAAVSGSVPAPQLTNWTTRDVLQRMLVAHHPLWKAHFSTAWSPDRTVYDEVDAYLKEYPQFPDALIDELL